MAFKDLSEFYDPDLHLPYKGKTYVVPAADLDTGLYLQTIFNLGVKANSGAISDESAAQFDDDEEVDFMERCLGRELLDELRADKVPTPVASLMAQTLMVDTVADRTTAEQFWASGGKAPASNRDRRRTATRTRTGAANTTRKPASRNGTSTRKVTANEASAGRKSSKSGTSSKRTSTKSTE